MALALLAQVVCSVIVTITFVMTFACVCVGGDLGIKFCHECGRVGINFFDTWRAADENLATVDNR